jgi:hypothetical protein
MQEISWKAEMAVALLALLFAVLSAYIAYQHRPNPAR